MRGFSLVELAIVLVILGLLTGGILAGQSLIRAAELRSVVSDQARFFTAIRSFQEKYIALPGDMNSATRFWPSAINGNGDGLFGNYAGQGVVAWQHLTLAGMIEGSYPGTQATPTQGICVAGTECPPSRISTLAFLTVTNLVAVTPPYNTHRQQGIILYTGNLDYGTGIKPEDAWQLDAKLDDSRPGTGQVIGMGAGGWLNGNGWQDCATTSDGSTYDLSRTTNSCRMFFLLR